ncbi:hypothetical protein [Variovorax sp. ZT4R33]|uniref:hypothetical protein n=1 Tax=Variovorax sp. ZT4R33 TaxID=3443743 RepID=UPI003F45C344
MRRALLAVTLAMLCGGAQAACDSGLAERMHAKLHPKQPLDHERALCEPWRAFPGRFIVVLPVPQPGSEPDNTTFDLDILVVQQADNGNTERATIVSRLLERSALAEDALRIAALKIDTARYTLTPDARAFGLRVIYRGSSRANPYESERLTLYVPEGPRLTKVLHGLEVALERGEWDTNCPGAFETVRGTLSPARPAGGGYADLVLRQTRSESVSTPDGENCLTHERPATFRTTTLHFEGNRYRVPKGITAD